MKTDTTAIPCQKRIRAIHDTMDVIGGKWKVSIIASLSYGKKRYSEILKDVDGISGKVLSRDLKELETNLLITRTVICTRPIAVEYALTDYCEDLLPIIQALTEWGLKHRKTLFSD